MNPSSSANTALIGGEMCVQTMGEESIAPYWVEDIERVRADLDEIDKKRNQLNFEDNQLVGALENIYKDRVAAVFDDKIKQCDAQIASYTQNLTRMFHKCESRLKNLQKRQYTNETEARIFKNVQKGLASRLQELSMAYRKKQKQFFQKLRSVDVGLATTGADDDLLETGFNQTQKGAMDMMRKETQSREQEIQQIGNYECAKSAQELAQIFKDLNQLVIEQGTIVDRIDYNMDQAVVKVKEGLQQVVKAEEYKKSSRPYTIIAVLVLIIVVCIVLKVLQAKANGK
ncbi:syntaxin [Blastocystis sp. subtype 4]|uniref:syntaxin n=1 Tax=Blastocystis sp. subtype 4 TaxID=944170 RepID=UPI0007119862|nr:syntaxin [Blastocystis sp. subtype 4]KNB44392.1 syntaxin [Blastocystis sp. subtype 4]|eukprot:XP_014527835.1 syntaxin [Blastocystis sp. subtype 4]